MENNITQIIKPRVTPKDFFLWAGAMLTLYISVFSFISLIFDYINYVFPSKFFSYFTTDPYLYGVSYEMASIIVFFPIFILLIRLIHKNIERDEQRAEIWVRHWALYLTLFIAGFTIAVDLVTLIIYFFNGDVTLHFVFKVLVVLLVAGGGFLHFLADLRGYWQRNPTKARIVGWATIALAALTVFAGFLVMGTPWQASRYRYDVQKVNNLQKIQGQIISYWGVKQALPATLADVTRQDLYNTVPMDAQTGKPYEYHITGQRSFELCATFNNKTQPRTANTAFNMDRSSTKNAWYHGVGHVCFSHTIDPSHY